ncbi:Rho GTPase-activating protein 1 [Sesamum alatum]|uniref:Rho GTPase-activating protein 1 n=1 Tax=Sesamum alatum TaxID=300844 RepID=A0AAE2CS90_9LAMI|nr:Rho GTPase-activating protein 1 [Sesamum alatum]
MTVILPSSASCNNYGTPTSNDALPQQTCLNNEPLIDSNVPVALYTRNCTSIQEVGFGDVGAEGGEEVSVLAVLVTVLRKSLVGCRSTGGENCGFEEKLMEIGCPTDVRHVAHVTFDRFDGFLGLPVEFEPEVPRRPPSASTRVFGVSTDSMQLSFDPRGNCVPTILLMMQERLYSQGGLQSEGIFRINPENGQEEYVRERLNNGVIPDNIDVHCLAGLIKAWFRELPNGVLDSLPPEQVMEAQSEDECAHLVRLLPPTEAALLDWAVNLMADVAQLEHLNKMNARNIAMVFAPNMTQMSDPLTALMYAVQVMNFLKTLIVRTLREREECLVEAGPTLLQPEPSDEDGAHSISKPVNLEADEAYEGKEVTVANEPQAESRTANEPQRFLSSIENILPANSPADVPNSLGTTKDRVEGGNTANRVGRTQSRSQRTKTSQTSNANDAKNGSRKRAPSPVVRVNKSAEKTKEPDVISRVNSYTERVEVWR